MVLAFAIYAGNPESVAVLMLTAVVLLGLLLGVQVWRKGVVAVLPAGGSLLVATLAGGALAAPLVLPGYQLGNLTTRVNLGEINNIPSNALTLILIPNYFRLLNNVPEIGFAAHVPSTIGFIAAPFALVAVACRWRNWEIRAVAILAVFLIALAFISPVESLINHLPFLNKVYWSRALMPLALVLSVLAGVGADVILRRAGPVRRSCGCWPVSSVWASGSDTHGSPAAGRFCRPWSRREIMPSSGRSSTCAPVWPSSASCFWCSVDEGGVRSTVRSMVRSVMRSVAQRCLGPRRPKSAIAEHPGTLLPVPMAQSRRRGLRSEPVWRCWTVRR